MSAMTQHEGADRPRRRWPRVLRIVAGCVLLVVAVVVPLGSVHTKTPPVVSCGGPAIRIAIDEHAASVTPERSAECGDRARATLVGGLVVALVPGLMLLFWSRITGRRGGRRQASEDARSLATGEWRMSVFARNLASLGMVVPALVLALVATADFAAAALATAFLVGWVALLYLTCIRPRIEIAHDLVVITNPMSRRAFHLADVERACAGYWGIALQVRGHGIANAWAGQKSNWAVWRDKQTHADDIVDDLERRAATAHTTPLADFTLSGAERESRRRATGKEMIVAGAIAAGVFLVRILVQG